MDENAARQNAPAKPPDSGSRIASRDMIIALLPALGVSLYVFGARPAALALIAIISCALFDWVYRAVFLKDRSPGDLSCVVTGLLFAYTLPPGAPYWMPAVGSLIAVVLIKRLLGGVGKVYLHPALSARVLLFSWPAVRTAWMLPKSYEVIGGFFNLGSDALTGATPMAYLSRGELPPQDTILELFIGHTGGSLGEISAAALLLGGLYLILRRVITAHVPLAYILTVAVAVFAFPLGGATRLDWTLYSVLGGGLFLGAFFMAADPAGFPSSPAGRIIFGVGCGALTVLIRYLAPIPEGVAYAVLIMNALAGPIDKLMGLRASKAVSPGEALSGSSAEAESSIPTEAKEEAISTK